MIMGEGGNEFHYMEPKWWEEMNGRLNMEMGEGGNEFHYMEMKWWEEMMGDWTHYMEMGEGGNENIDWVNEGNEGCGEKWITLNG